MHQRTLATGSSELMTVHDLQGLIKFPYKEEGGGGSAYTSLGTDTVSHRLMIHTSTIYQDTAVKYRRETGAGT